MLHNHNYAILVNTTLVQVSFYGTFLENTFFFQSHIAVLENKGLSVIHFIMIFQKKTVISKPKQIKLKKNNFIFIFFYSNYFYSNQVKIK